MAPSRFPAGIRKGAATNSRFQEFRQGTGVAPYMRPEIAFTAQELATRIDNCSNGT